MVKKLEIMVSGRVQGIGYRAFALKYAWEFDIKGYVQNLSDGRVKVVAVGEDKKMAHFIKKLRKGPAFSLVRDIAVNELDRVENYRDFRIEY